MLALLLLGVGAYLVSESELFGDGSNPEMREDRDVICAYATSEHPACIWAFVIARSTADPVDCGAVEPAIPKLLDAFDGLSRRGGGGGAVDLGALNAVKVATDKLVATAQRLCPAQ